MPNIYLTNWSSVRTRAHHGGGRTLCAMARPRHWEHGDGHCPDAHAPATLVNEVLSGAITIEHYRRATNRIWLTRDFAPGSFSFLSGIAMGPSPVEDGDTLCCACPRIGSPRRAHECHLEWLAPFLVRAGWRVFLYGMPFSA